MVMRIAIALLMAALLPADDKKTVETTCPIDGNKFQVWDVTSIDHARAWGGLDRDFCRHAFKTTPMEYAVWVCPTCGFAGTKVDFDPKRAPSEEQKKAIAGNLKPAVPLRKGMKQDAIPGHAKFDLMTQVSILEGVSGDKTATGYLCASWCARQQGAIALDAFDEWIEIRKAHNLEILPLDLKDRNRTDLELDAALKIEKKIEERRETEKRDLQTVKDAEAKIAGEKKKDQPDAAVIQAEEKRRGDARGRLHYIVMLKYSAMYLYRRHGENPAALRWIEELRQAKGDNSVIDDAVEKTAASIELERSYQRKAVEFFEKALDGGKLEKADAARAQYHLGELYRRLGENAKAADRYRKAADEPSLKRWAEEQLRLVE